MLSYYSKFRIAKLQKYCGIWVQSASLTKANMCERSETSWSSMHNTKGRILDKIQSQFNNYRSSEHMIYRNTSIMFLSWKYPESVYQFQILRTYGL
jgi:hypothetical protein